jgi:hypothetical protein
MRAALAVALLVSTEALACGVCVEDKIAAVYDHAAVHQALAAKRTVVFFHIDGKLVADERTKRAIAGIARATPGVDAASVRVSCELASMALAFDGRRDEPREGRSRSLEKRLSRRVSRSWRCRSGTVADPQRT